MKPTSQGADGITDGSGGSSLRQLLGWLLLHCATSLPGQRIQVHVINGRGCKSGELALHLCHLKQMESLNDECDTQAAVSWAHVSFHGLLYS